MCVCVYTGVGNLVQKGYKKISPFFIPYAITNMGGALLAIDQVKTHCAHVCVAPLSLVTAQLQGAKQRSLQGCGEPTLTTKVCIRQEVTGLAYASSAGVRVHGQHQQVTCESHVTC